MTLGRALLASALLAPAATAEDLRPSFVFFLADDHAERARWHATYDPLNAAFRADPPTGDDLVRWKYQRYLHDYRAWLP